MRVSRTITVTTSYRDIVRALKSVHPALVHVQSLPDEIRAGVGVEMTSAKGLEISFTSAVPGGEA